MTHSTEYRRILNRMGYYNYQNGLIYRHMSQDGGWDNHLSNCRSYIMRALELFKPEKVTILGSGWLLDIPLAEMLEQTRKICLVDIVHPPDVVRQAAGFPNVELIEQDVTGGLIRSVWEETRRHSLFNKLKTLSALEIPEYAPDFYPGLIISLNILTQLESLPAALLKKTAKISPEEMKQFRHDVQERHLNFLRKFNSVLLSDFEEVSTDNNGRVTTEPTILAEIPEGISREEWQWDFDLKGGDYYNSTSIMRVLAITFRS
jgi:hypothetical protein